MGRGKRKTYSLKVSLGQDPYRKSRQVRNRARQVKNRGQEEASAPNPSRKKAMRRFWWSKVADRKWKMGRTLLGSVSSGWLLSRLTKGGELGGRDQIHENRQTKKCTTNKEPSH